MGCCQNSENFLGYKNKTSSSTSLTNIKETNLSNGIKIDSSIYLDKVLKTILRNKTPKLTLSKYKKFKVLDKIREEEAESLESSNKRPKMLSREKLDSNFKKEKHINKNSKLENMKILRKNRSHPKFKIKLNEEMFIKKLNEYKDNKFKSNYISQLSHLKESKSEQLFNKSIGDVSLKESINKINIEKINKKKEKNKRNNIYNKKRENKIQIYEEEINKKSLQHIPKSISNIIFKKSMTEKENNTYDF